MNETTLDRSESSALHEFCAGFLRCGKNIGLYPREHPRVQSALEDLSQTISKRSQETAKPFIIDATCLEDLVDRTDEDDTDGVDTEEIHVYGTLSHLLKLHLIEKVQLHPQICLEELYEFSCLLQEDLFKAPEADADSFDPTTWESIQLSFYTPQDFPDDLSARKTLLGRAAGLHRSEKVDKLLGELPPKFAARIREALATPAFLRKISELRRQLRESTPDTDGQKEEQVDVIATALQNVADIARDGDTASTAEIFATVDDVVQFMEKNLDPLTLGSVNQLARDTASGSRPPEQRQPPRGQGAGATDQITNFQELKERFSSALQIARRGESARRDGSGVTYRTEDVPRSRRAPGETPESEPVPARENGREPTRNPAKEINSRRSRCSLEEMFSHVDFDKDAYREAFRPEDLLFEYLHVILELLCEPVCQPSIRKNWRKVLESLTAKISDRNFMESVVKDVAEFSGEIRLTAGEELLSVLLEAVHSTADAQRMLEENVVPNAGQPFAARTLDRMIQRHPRRSIELLTRLHLDESSPLRPSAELNLLSLSKNPALLESWAEECPEGLIRADVLAQIVNRESPDRLLDTFKAFFTHAPPEKALRLLHLITAELPGVDYIVITAIQYGPPEVRDYALDFLDKHCVPVVTGALIHTVRLNNYLDRPCMPEVEVALDALIRVDEPRAKKFLKEVEKNRSGWLNYEYRKEIREALTKLLERGSKN